MAKKATVFRATVQVSDMDRGFYEELNLTLAQHPSETDERMMVRLLAFVLNAGELLQFTRGLYADDEPDLWKKSLSGEIETWIDLGLPTESRIRKACARAQQVILYAYGGRSVQLWWEKNQAKLQRFNNLTVIELPPEATRSLASLADRNMQLQCTIEDGQIWISSDATQVSIDPVFYYRSS